MAFTPIIMSDGNPHPYWEYDNADTTLGAVAGIRQSRTGFEVYTKTRRIGSTKDTMGELSKSFWDNHYTT